MFSLTHLWNRVAHELRVLVTVVEKTQTNDRGIAMDFKGYGLQVRQAVGSQDRLLFIYLLIYLVNDSKVL